MLAPSFVALQERGFCDDPLTFHRFSATTSNTCLVSFTKYTILLQNARIDSVIVEREINGIGLHALTQVQSVASFVWEELDTGSIQYHDMLELLRNLVSLARVYPLSGRIWYPQEYWDAQGDSRPVVKATWFTKSIERHGQCPRNFMVALCRQFLRNICKPLLRVLARNSIISNFKRDVSEIEKALRKLVDPWSSTNEIARFMDMDTKFEQYMYNAVARAEVFQRLGKGQYGKLYKADIPELVPVNIKRAMFKKTNSDLVALSLLSEVSIPFLSYCLGYFVTKYSREISLYIITLSEISIDMSHYITACKKSKFPLEFLRNLKVITAQIVLAYHCFHRMGICHSDIKLENLVININGKVIIIDIEDTVTAIGHYTGPISGPEPDVVRRCRLLTLSKRAITTRYTRSIHQSVGQSHPSAEWSCIGMCLFAMASEWEDGLVHGLTIGRGGLLGVLRTEQMYRHTLFTFEEVFWGDICVDDEFKELVECLVKHDYYDKATGFEDIRLLRYFRNIDFEEVYNAALHEKPLIECRQALLDGMAQLENSLQLKINAMEKDIEEEELCGPHFSYYSPVLFKTIISPPVLAEDIIVPRDLSKIVGFPEIPS